MASVVREKISTQLGNIDALLVRNEYKVKIYTDYFLGSLRYLFSVHDLQKAQLKELDSLTHRYLKKWLGLPRGVSWVLVHDVHGMNVKSISHLYLESRSLTLSNIRFFSDGRVRHALDTKEERERAWCRKFSSAIYTKGLIEEVVTPVTFPEISLTEGNALDASSGSWSSLGLDGLLSPIQSPLPDSQPLSSPTIPIHASTPVSLPLPVPPLSPTPNAPPLPHVVHPPTPPPLPPTVHPPNPSNQELTRKLLKRKIQKGVQDRVNDFWREKIGHYVMQGDYLALIIEEGSCITWKSYMWDIPQGVLKFAVNAGVNTLPTCDNLKRWGKRTNDRCSFCGNIQTLAHVLSNCETALNQGRFTWRHNSVLTSIIRSVLPFLREDMSLYSDMPGYQAPHGGTIPPHVLVTALKPDIFVFSRQSQEVVVLELTCP